MNENHKLPGIKKNILEEAIEAVYQQTGLRLILPDNNVIEESHDEITIMIEGNFHLHFTAKVKRWAQQANFGALVNEIQQLSTKGILAADYVNPRMADKLRKLDIPFIDTAGNVFINEKPTYLFVKGIKNTHKTEISNQPKETQTHGRAFMPSGLKVVYAFIQSPKLIDAPYREIANISGVALGTVGWVINDLKLGGYLVAFDEKKRRLTNKKHLLNKWVDAYLEKLRPKLFLGNFSAEDDSWWMKLDKNIVDYGTLWGGEIAASKLTGYIKPEKVILYRPKEGNNKLFADNRFRKDPNGNIQVFQAFWDIDEKHILNSSGLVEPLIVYADLLATGDSRNLETARVLYDKELTGFIQED